MRELKKGMKILFFGTSYVIDKVLDYDRIQVVQGNGNRVTLWFPDLPGREIIEK